MEALQIENKKLTEEIERLLIENKKMKILLNNTNKKPKKEWIPYNEYKKLVQKRDNVNMFI
jgi:hypothetical protein